MNIEEYKGYPLFDSLIELNNKMIENNCPKIELNTIGGFALIFYDVRGKNDKTDIDYIGANLTKDVENLSDEIGLKNNLGTGWINNECLRSGTTIEDLEFTTGKLHFLEAFDLEKIKVNIIAPEDLLRLKVIAIDTQLCAINTSELLELTRFKDFKDLEILMKRQNVSIEDIKGSPDKYMIADKHTPHIIDTYLNHGIEAVKDEIRSCMMESLRAYEKIREHYKNEVYVRSPLIDDVLNKTIKRVNSDMER